MSGAFSCTAGAITFKAILFKGSLISATGCFALVFLIAAVVIFRLKPSLKDPAVRLQERLKIRNCIEKNLIIPYDQLEKSHPLLDLLLTQAERDQLIAPELRALPFASIVESYGKPPAGLYHFTFEPNSLLNDRFNKPDAPINIVRQKLFALATVSQKSIESYRRELSAFDYDYLDTLFNFEAKALTTSPFLSHFSQFFINFGDFRRLNTNLVLKERVQQQFTKVLSESGKSCLEIRQKFTKCFFSTKDALNQILDRETTELAAGRMSYVVFETRNGPEGLKKALNGLSGEQWGNVEKIYWSQDEAELLRAQTYFHPHKTKLQDHIKALWPKRSFLDIVRFANEAEIDLKEVRIYIATRWGGMKVADILKSDLEGLKASISVHKMFEADDFFQPQKYFGDGTTLKMWLTDYAVLFDLMTPQAIEKARPFLRIQLESEAQTIEDLCKLIETCPKSLFTLGILDPKMDKVKGLVKGFIRKNIEYYMSGEIERLSAADARICVIIHSHKLCVFDNFNKVLPVVREQCASFFQKAKEAKAKKATDAEVKESRDSGKLDPATQVWNQAEADLREQFIEKRALLIITLSVD
ncbi:MAG: hypothetical protein H0X51_08975 [Parachlamydiaceae bacterium]|nr:hypothetical protein [Parachlamydiaceae bacterium]